jgi:DNA-binding transcriptional LysR family regulator
LELTTATAFEPHRTELRLRIAANDFQRDILLPEVLRATRDVLKRLQLEVIPSGIPSSDMLNKDEVDLLITPHPPLGSDIYQQRVFHDQRVCFYDPRIRKAPRSLSSYSSAKHISLRFSVGDQMALDDRLEHDGIFRDVEIAVATFSAIPTFMAGTALIATLPSLLERGLMRDFASCPVPFDTGSFDMYMVWHRRVHRDPAHRWFRTEVAAVGEALRQ